MNKIKELATALDKHKANRGKKMQWVRFDKKPDADAALKKIKTLYSELPGIKKANVTQTKKNDFKFGLTHGQWREVVGKHINMHEAQMDFVDYFIGNRKKPSHPKRYQKRINLINQLASEQTVFFLPEFLPVYEAGHHKDHLKIGYKPIPKKNYTPEEIDLAPSKQQSTFRSLTRNRIVYGKVPVYFNGFDKKPAIIPIISACAVNLMGSSKDDEKKFILKNGRLNEEAFIDESKRLADFLLGTAKKNNYKKFIMPAFGVGVYIKKLNNPQDKARAKEIMNQAFAEMARKHTIYVDWIVWENDKKPKPQDEKSKLDKQTQDNPYMNHVIGDLLNHAKKEQDKGEKCVVLNPGSDRTIGGKYTHRNPTTLEEQIAQQSDLIFLQTVYNETMMRRFEKDLENANKSYPVSVLLEQMQFEKHLEDFKNMQNKLQNKEALDALNNFISEITTAKEGWLEKPSQGKIFVAHCQKAVDNAANSALNDFKEWHILVRSFMKAVNWLLSFIIKKPLFKTDAYAKISLFGEQVKETEDQNKDDPCFGNAEKNLPK